MTKKNSRTYKTLDEETTIKFLSEDNGSNCEQGKNPADALRGRNKKLQTCRGGNRK